MLKIPVDDEFFNRTNDAQFVWYSVQAEQDEIEKYELLRDVAEHNAMFWNSEAVEQIREARRNTFGAPDKEFDDTLVELFGRGLSDEESDPIEILEKNRANPYLDMEMDEIKFIPE